MEIINKYINYLGNKSEEKSNVKLLARILNESVSKVSEKICAHNKKIEQDYQMKRLEEELFGSEDLYTLEYIDSLDGYLFEDYLGKLFKEFGYEVEQTPYSGDYGADLIISDHTKRIVIQAKNYSSNVGNSAIQEVIAAEAHYGCDKAMAITNSYYTKSAEELSKTTGVILIDRNNLEEILNKGRLYFNDLCLQGVME